MNEKINNLEDDKARLEAENKKLRLLAKETRTLAIQAIGEKLDCIEKAIRKFEATAKAKIDYEFHDNIMYLDYAIRAIKETADEMIGELG